MTELEKEHKEVVDKITKLQKRKSEIEKLLIESADNFLDKFRIWYENDDECHSDYIVSSPILRELIEDKDYRRYETIDLERLIGYDEFDLLLYPDEHKSNFDSEEEFQKYFDETLEKYQPALQEAMETGVKSFDLDW